MAVKRFEATLRLDSGLLIPASAGAGKILSSDAEGNATWVPQQLEYVTFAISGVVAAKSYPGFFVKLVTGEKRKLIAVRYKLKKGKIKIAVEKGEAEIAGGAYKALAAAEAAASTESAVELLANDYINIKTATAEEMPEDLAITLFLESTK